MTLDIQCDGFVSLNTRANHSLERSQHTEGSLGLFLVTDPPRVTPPHTSSLWTGLTFPYLGSQNALVRSIQVVCSGPCFHRCTGVRCRNISQFIYPFCGWAFGLCQPFALINRAAVEFLVLVHGAHVDSLGVHPGWKAGSPHSVRV